MARIEAGTTATEAYAALTVTESPAVQSTEQSASVYVIFKGLSDTAQERDVSLGAATVLEVKSTPDQETLT